MQQQTTAASAAGTIRQVDTFADDPVQAAAEIDYALGNARHALIIVWSSGDCPLADTSSALAERRPEARVLGAIGSAVLGPRGYRSHGISATAFPADADVVTASLGDVSRLDFAQGFQAASWLKSELHRISGQPAEGENTFALLLVDGLAQCEERLVASVAQGLGTLNLVGASTGDHFRRLAGRIWYQGRSQDNTAVLVLVRPRRAFQAFSTHHFTPGDQRLLVTRADPARRVVLELNGEPATRAYARAIGQPPEMLTPAVLAARPLAVKVGDSHYVRSVRLVSTDPDEGLVFTCAIDQGIVLRVAHPGDLIADLRDRLHAVATDLGGVASTLAFDCALRHLELEADHLLPTADALLARFTIGGLASYGEQFGRMHLNQTFTGIAFAHE